MSESPTKRADMPALPDPFVKPLAANGLASKPGLYTVGQVVRYAQQYAEQRVREEREACAALCEAEAAFVKSDRDGGSAAASNCATAIRARSQP